MAGLRSAVGEGMVLEGTWGRLRLCHVIPPSMVCSRRVEDEQKDSLQPALIVFAQPVLRDIMSSSLMDVESPSSLLSTSRAPSVMRTIDRVPGIVARKFCGSRIEIAILPDCTSSGT